MNRKTGILSALAIAAGVAFTPSIARANDAHTPPVIRYLHLHGFIFSILNEKLFCSASLKANAKVNKNSALFATIVNKEVRFSVFEKEEFDDAFLFKGKKISQFFTYDAKAAEANIYLPDGVPIKSSTDDLNEYVHGIDFMFDACSALFNVTDGIPENQKFAIVDHHQGQPSARHTKPSHHTKPPVAAARP